MDTQLKGRRARVYKGRDEGLIGTVVGRLDVELYVMIMDVDGSIRKYDGGVLVSIPEPDAEIDGDWSALLATPDPRHERERLGATMKALRRDKGLTLDRLARLVGVSKQYIQSIESGKSMSLDTLVKVADFLDASVQIMSKAAAPAASDHDSDTTAASAPTPPATDGP